MLMVLDDTLAVHAWVCPQCGNIEPAEPDDDEIECACDLFVVVMTDEDLDAALAMYALYARDIEEKCAQRDDGVFMRKLMMAIEAETRSSVEDSEKVWVEQCNRHSLRPGHQMLNRFIARDGQKNVYAWVCPQCGRVAVVRDDDIGAKCACTNEMFVMTTQSEEIVFSASSLEIVKENLEMSGHVLIKEGESS